MNADQLVAEHHDLVVGLSRRYESADHDAEDLAQIALLALTDVARRLADDGSAPAGSTPAQAAGSIPAEAGSTEAQVRRTIVRDVRARLRAVTEPSHGDGPAADERLDLRLEELAGRLRLTLRREPTLAELATSAGVPRERVVAAMASRSWGVAETTAAAVPDPAGPVVERAALQDALARLDERDRNLVRLRYVHDLPQHEIGRRLGISQMHVSRLLRRLSEELRRELA